MSVLKVKLNPNRKSYISVYSDGRVYFSMSVRENYKLFHNSIAAVKYSNHQKKIYLYPDYPTHPMPPDYTGLKITNAYAKAKRLNMKPGKYVFVSHGNVVAFQRVPDDLI
ncbi:hypothetical protein [Cytobacillus massiliigabonensis]|uniref:hypothetical protein n=1 Tax=Cytobacillus massiliigabonensis TaxID=1871011 RepID=UPI000C82B29E|nr:hypothetical protein [Cytobacillus massiliigabonensis]